MTSIDADLRQAVDDRLNARREAARERRAARDQERAAKNARRAAGVRARHARILNRRNGQAPEVTGDDP